jgi:D-lyxose ketol-isomerase
MITCAEQEQARRAAGALFTQAGIALRPEELAQVEVADFGLSELAQSGAQILTLLDSDKMAVKLLALLPGQTEPEHTHPRQGAYAGKEETVRCAWGELYLYGPGEASPTPRACPPAHRRQTYTVWHEHILHPGDQVTFQPGQPHWFQAGPDGVVVWSYSTKATDLVDVFTDPAVRRQTVVTG